MLRLIYHDDDDDGSGSESVTVASCGEPLVLCLPLLCTEAAELPESLGA